MKLLLPFFFVLFFPINAFASDWQYSQNSDPFVDDADLHVATLTSEGALGELGQPQLIARCTPQKRFEFIISLGSYIGGTSEGIVNFQYRFDSTPSLYSWGNVASKGDYFFVFGPRSDSFASAIAASEKLAIRVADFKGTTFTHVFDLTGQNGEIRRVKEACGLSIDFDRKVMQHDLERRQSNLPSNAEAAKKVCVQKLAEKGLSPWKNGSEIKVMPSEKNIVVMGNSSNRRETEHKTFLCVWQDGYFRHLSTM